jgi:diadenosine tetraphosphate (Ap4A) HIT family hydrolase
MMEGCIFCELSKDTSKHLFKDGVCYVVLDKYPIAEGHLLIISNDHHENMLDTPDKIMDHMFRITKKFYRRVWDELKPIGCSVVTNRGPGHVNHFHIHIIPRYTKEKAVNPSRNDLDDETAQRMIKKLKQKD